jgi:hypothetical protein
MRTQRTSTHKRAQSKTRRATAGPRARTRAVTRAEGDIWSHLWIRASSTAQRDFLLGAYSVLERHGARYLRNVCRTVANAFNEKAS